MLWLLVVVFIVVVVVFVVVVVIISLVLVVVLVVVLVLLVFLVMLFKRNASNPYRNKSWCVRLVLHTTERAPVEPRPMLLQLFIG